MKKDNKKMMLWGCSIEPSDIPGEMAEHLSLFDAITVRDPLSYQALIDNIHPIKPKCLIPIYFQTS